MVCAPSGSLRSGLLGRKPQTVLRTTLYIDLGCGYDWRGGGSTGMRGSFGENMILTRKDEELGRPGSNNHISMGLVQH